MLTFLFDKVVIVKRYSSTLGEYNRPKKDLITVGTYECHIAEGSSNTSQLQPQKKNTTEGTLYTDPEVDIHKGDILYVYEVDEYGNAIESTCYKYIADKPYKKRTKLQTPLLSESEV